MGTALGPHGVAIMDFCKAYNAATEAQRGTIVPILGTRSETQMKDDLGCLDFELAPEHLDRLSEASPIELGFPRSFLESDHVRGLIFGETFDLIDHP